MHQLGYGDETTYGLKYSLIKLSVEDESIEDESVEDEYVEVESVEVESVELIDSLDNDLLNRLSLPSNTLSIFSNLLSTLLGGSLLCVKKIDFVKQ